MHALFLPFVVCLHRPPALPPYRTQGHHSSYSTSRSPFTRDISAIAKAREGEDLCELGDLLAELVHHVRGQRMLLLLPLPTIHPPPLHRQAAILLEFEKPLKLELGFQG